MSKTGRINLRDFKNYKDAVARLSREQLDATLRSTARGLGLAMLKKVVYKTPVGQYPSGSGRVGGTLRRGWQIDPNVVKTSEGAYSVTVYNPVEYASYVEYGHRTRNHSGWVEGQFFMTNSAKEIEVQAPAYVEHMLNEAIKRTLG